MHRKFNGNTLSVKTGSTENHEKAENIISEIKNDSTGKTVKTREFSAKHFIIERNYLSKIPFETVLIDEISRNIKP